MRVGCCRVKCYTEQPMNPFRLLCRPRVRGSSVGGRSVCGAAVLASCGAAVLASAFLASGPSAVAGFFHVVKLRNVHLINQNLKKLFTFLEKA